jgi:hypothetical protein
MNHNVLISTLTLAKDNDPIMLDLLDFLTHKYNIKINSYEYLKNILQLFKTNSRIIVFQKIMNFIEIEDFIQNTNNLSDLNNSNCEMNYANLLIDLIKKKLISIKNSVEFSVICNMFPHYLFNFLSLIKKNINITDEDKYFTIINECRTFVNDFIQKNGKNEMAKILSDFFWETKYYMLCCQYIDIENKDRR